MLNQRNYLKILKSVIQLVAIAVMDVFRWQERAAKKRFHDSSMCLHSLTGNRDSKIPIGGDVAAARFSINSMVRVSIFAVTFIMFMAEPVRIVREIAVGKRTNSSHTGLVERATTLPSQVVCIAERHQPIVNESCHEAAIFSNAFDYITSHTSSLPYSIRTVQ